MHAEYCRIERWRGYFSSSFYVHLPDQTLESQSFRWRREAPPSDGGPARAAYDELVSRLEGAGWTRHSEGADWFATTFTRLIESLAEVRLERVDHVAHQEPLAIQIPAPIQRQQLDPAPLQVSERRPEMQPAETSAASALKQVPGRGRRWVAPIAAGAFVVAGVASGFLLFAQRGNGKSEVVGGAARTVAPPQQPSKVSSGPTPVTSGVAGSAHSVSTKPVGVDLRIAAHGSGSWLEIRRSSATGPILYSATLTDGQTLHFHAPKLWGRFGAASNLTITANAHPVRIQGTYEKLFVAPR